MPRRHRCLRLHCAHVGMGMCALCTCVCMRVCVCAVRLAGRSVGAKGAAYACTVPT